jgi:acetate---CoA ligase (ADP-forming)
MVLRLRTKAAYPHPWVDGLVVLYCETAVSDPLDIAKGIKQAVDESGMKDKPVCISFVGGERCEAAMKWLVENGIPAYGAPDVAINAMAALREYARMKEMVKELKRVALRHRWNREKALQIIARRAR